MPAPTPTADALAAPGRVRRAHQPLVAGAVASFVGFASTFAVVLSGLRAVGATPAQAASGLLAVCLVSGLATVVWSVRTRLPITLVWPTPGAALLLGAANGYRQRHLGAAAAR